MPESIRPPKLPDDAARALQAAKRDEQWASWMRQGDRPDVPKWGTGWVVAVLIAIAVVTWALVTGSAVSE